MRMANGRKRASGQVWLVVCAGILTVLAGIQIAQRLHVEEVVPFDVPRANDMRGTIPILDLRGMRAHGTVTNLGAVTDGGCTYVYIFSYRCPWCHRNAPRWTGVRGVNAEGTPYPLLWLSVDSEADSARAYLEQYGLVGAAYMVRSQRAVRALGAIATPSMWIVARGRVVSMAEAVRPDSIAMAPDECVRGRAAAR